MVESRLVAAGTRNEYIDQDINSDCGSVDCVCHPNFKLGRQKKCKRSTDYVVIQFHRPSAFKV